jgi:hypothetical protein
MNRSELYRQIANKLAAEASVKTIRFDRKDLSGCACADEGWISVPRPTTLLRLYIFAHECGHIALNHDNRIPDHQAEYEAEQWAHEAFGHYNLDVPLAATLDAIKNVTYCCALCGVTKVSDDEGHFIVFGKVKMRNRHYWHVKGVRYTSAVRAFRAWKRAYPKDYALLSSDQSDAELISEM